MLKLIFGLILVAGTLRAENAAMPQLGDARVTIPYAELKALWQAAQREKETPKPAPKPPVDVALIAARYRVTLQQDHGDVVAEFEAQSYTDDWSVIPLLGTDVQIASVEPAEAQIILRDGRYTLMTHGPGRTKLTIHFTAPLDASSDTARLRFTTPRALVNSVAVSGTPEGKTLRVEGATEVASEKGSANFQMRALDSLDLQLLSPKQIAPPVPSRWKVNAQAFVQLGEGRLTYQTRLLARSDAGSGLDMDLKLPPAANVLRVKGEDVADWQARSDGDRGRAVHVRWKTRNILNREIELGYELPQPSTTGEWRLFAPQVENGEMGGALFVVVGEDGLELTPTVDAGPLPGRLPRWLAELAGMQKYVVVDGGGLLQARWLPTVATTPAVIEHAQATMKVVSDGALLNEVVYAIRTEAPLTWQLRLPKGSELLTCAVNGRPVSPINRGDDLIELPLAARDGKSANEVKLSYTAKKPAFKPVSGQVELELPATGLLIHRLDWEIHLPPAYALTALEGNVEPDDAGGSSRVIRLKKELCKNETPSAQIFYEKPETKK